MRPVDLWLEFAGATRCWDSSIEDPNISKVMSAASTGLSLLDIETVFEGEKITSQVDGTHIASGSPISGYEIHCGRITILSGNRPFRISRRDGRSHDELEGVFADGLVGTSIHGLFDAPEFRRYFLNQIRKRKGLAPLAVAVSEDASAIRAQAYDRFAHLLRTHLKTSVIAELIGINPERLLR